MKIILIDKIFNLGNVGSIINTKFGYAYNFLIPKGLAILNNTKNINYFKKNNQIIIFKKKNNIINKILFIIFFVKCDNKGDLFGSINFKKIINILNNYNFKVIKKNIINFKIIRKIGNYIIEIKFNNLFKKKIMLKIKKIIF